jgi:hypothetical protein
MGACCDGRARDGTTPTPLVLRDYLHVIELNGPGFRRIPNEAGNEVFGGRGI